MREIPQLLKLALAAEASTIAVCWQIIRADGVAVGLTTHDRDIWVEGCLYQASPGLHPAAALQPTPSDAVSTEALGALSATAITRTDLEDGRYDGAKARCFLVDWTQPEGGRFVLQAGTLGAISMEGEQFHAELVSVLGRLKHSFGETFSPECRAIFSDDRCMVDSSLYLKEAYIVSIPSSDAIELDRNLGSLNYYRYGRARFVTGAASGIYAQISWSEDRQIQLVDPPRTLAAGDRIEIMAGCDRRLVTCRSKFENVVNFRGEPYVPGVDGMSYYPGLV